MTKFLVVLFSFLICACTPQQGLLKSGEKVGSEGTAQSRSLLVGRWYGDMKAADGGHRQWLIERKADGSFISNFRVMNQGQTIEQSEYGSWGVSSDIYFTITSGFFHNGLPEAADSTDPTLYDAYRLLSLTQDSMTYRNLETGNTFKVRRVQSDFRIPSE